MWLFLLLTTVFQGPVQRGKKPDAVIRADQGDKLELDAPSSSGEGWEAILRNHPEAEVRRGGSLMAPLVLSLRGARQSQFNWSLDGLPMNDAFGGSAALRSLDPRLFGAASIFVAASSGIDAPLGGELALKSRGGPRFIAQIGMRSFGGFSMLMKNRNAKGGVAFSNQNTAGNFSYFDHRGTHFISSDDRWIKRRNNDSSQAGMRLHRRLTKNLNLSLLLSDLRGGIAGTGNRPLIALREHESLRMLHAKWSQLKGIRQHISFSILQRHNRLDDPLAELSGLLGLQPKSRQNRALIQWHAIKNTVNYGFELKTRLIAQRLTRQAGPLSQIMHGDRLLARLGGSYRIGRKRQLHSMIWASAGLAHDKLQALVDALPERLQNEGLVDAPLSLSPAISLHYQRSRLRLIAAERAPSVLERVGQHGGLRGNPSLRPERSLSIDFKQTFGAGKNRLSTSLFAKKSDDLIDWTATSFGRAMPINRARVQLLGSSLYGKYTIGSLALTAWYRWQREWVKDGFLQNTRLAASPEHSGAINLSLKQKRWTLVQQLSARSSIFLDAANLRRLSSKPELNIVVYYQILSALRLIFSVHNLSDEQQAHLNLFANPKPVLVPIQDRWGQALPGRSFRLAIEVRRKP
jgi:hypothetical protein